MIHFKIQLTFLMMLAFLSLPCEGQEIPTLVKNLGSSSFEEREKSTQELERIGEPALMDLRKALKSEDAEIRKRAEELVLKIEGNSRNRKLTQPTLVSLDFKEALVSEVVAEVVKQSGFRIILQDRLGNLASRKMTIHVSKVPFWRALELICEQAGLVEIAVPLNSSLAPVSEDSIPGGLLPRIRINPAQKAIPQSEKDAGNKKPMQEKPAPKKGFEQGRELQPIAPQGVGAMPPPPGGIRPLPDDLKRGGIPNRAGVIILGEGKRIFKATDTNSAYRIKVMERPEATFGTPPADRVLVGLEVTPEPRLKLRGIVSARVEKALDSGGKTLEHDANFQMKKEMDKPQPGRALARVMPIPGLKDANAPAWENRIPLYLIPNSNPSRSLIALEGKLTLQVFDEVQVLLEASAESPSLGKKIEGKKGGWLKVNEWSKMEDGSWKIRFEWDMPEGLANAGLEDPIAAQIVIQGNVPGLNPQIQIQQFGMAAGGFGAKKANGFEVLDRTGKAMTAFTQSSKFQQNQGGQALREMTLQFAAKGPEPATLNFKGSKTHTVEVPFALKNIPLEPAPR